jgi:uncharacterized membrane protein YfcA
VTRAAFGVVRMSIVVAGWIGLVFLVAGFVRGYSGFGFSAVTVVGLSFVVSPATAVATAILLEIAASLFQARSVRRDVDWRGTLVLLAGGLLGNPIGVGILEMAPETLLKAAVYGFLLAVSLILTFARPLRIELNSAAWFVIAVSAGIVNGATALSGLFIVAVMTTTGVAPARMRATLIAYFFFSDLYAAGLLTWRGLIDSAVLWQTLYALPLVGIGIVIGSRRFLGASDIQFRRATLALLTALSVAGLAMLLFRQM